MEETEMVLGYLVNNPASDHRVSFSDTILLFGSIEPVPLTRTLRAYFTGHNMGSMPHVRVQLAKQLASVMLQFRKTPLLLPNWTSDDMAFFDKPWDGYSAEATFQWPHLSVFICGENSGEQCPVGDRKGKQSGTQDVTMGQIFLGLATMLVEIALQRSLIDVLSSWHKYRTGYLPDNGAAPQNDIED